MGSWPGRLGEGGWKGGTGPGSSAAVAGGGRRLATVRGRRKSLGGGAVGLRWIEAEGSGEEQEESGWIFGSEGIPR